MGYCGQLGVGAPLQEGVGGMGDCRTRSIPNCNGQLCSHLLLETLLVGFDKVEYAFVQSYLINICCNAQEKLFINLLSIDLIVLIKT